MSSKLFWVFFTSVTLLVLLVQSQKFTLRFFRLKWLFLSVFLVYAFGTPGEYISNLSWAFLPTKEGIYLGLMQIAKLLIALSLLGLLIDRTAPKDLMLGLYKILSPLQLLKVDLRRFVVRLMLTLEYVDQFTIINVRAKNFVDIFNHIRQENQLDDMQSIALINQPFHLIDVIALLVTLTFASFILLGT
jgi:energy-coupling factor transport system permease protein